MTLQKRTTEAFGKRGFKKSPSKSKKAPSRMRRAVKAMTLREIAIKECGMTGYRKLSPRLKKLLNDVDSLAMNKTPATRREIDWALGKKTGQSLLAL